MLAVTSSARAESTTTPLSLRDDAATCASESSSLSTACAAANLARVALPGRVIMTARTDAAPLLIAYAAWSRVP